MSHDSDHLRTRIRCAACGQETGALIRMDLRTVDEGETFTVGSPYAPETDDLDGAYFVLRAPVDAEPLHVLAYYHCEACKRSYQWVEIVFADGRIQSAEAVELNRAALSRAHAVDDWLADVYRDHGDVRIDQMPAAERAAYILAHPPTELTRD